MLREKRNLPSADGLSWLTWEESAQQFLITILPAGGQQNQRPLQEAADRARPCDGRGEIGGTPGLSPAEVPQTNVRKDPQEMQRYGR